MASLHEEGIGNVRKIIGYILSALSSLGITASGIFKLSDSEQMKGAMDTAGLGDHIVFIGALEIACVVLYWIPRTSNLGFVLTASYIGGIIATEWGQFGNPTTGIILGVSLYVGTFLRKPSLSGLGI